MDLATWRFTLRDGARPIKSWSWAEFEALPRTTWHGDIHCVTKWSKFDTAWEGVAFDDLLSDAGIAAPSAFLLAESHVIIRPTCPSPTSSAAKHGRDALRRAPITPRPRRPARLFVPHLYFWKSAKWVKGLRFTKNPTRLASGSCAATTCTATPGASSGISVTDLFSASDAPQSIAPIVFRWETALIVATRAGTPSVKSVRLRCELARSYRPGQHVDVRLTAEDGYQAQRSYSIASAQDGSGTLELMVEGLPDGEVSGWFAQVAQAGDRVELRGPIGGSFSWDASDGGPLLLAGGGSAWCRCWRCCGAGRPSCPEIPAVLIYSVPHPREAIALAELAARDRDEPGFSLSLAITREPGGKRIDAGLVAAALDTLGPPGRSSSAARIASVGAASDLIVAAGVPPGLIRTERFGA